jgi:hypothetical protein
MRSIPVAVFPDYSTTQGATLSKTLDELRKRPYIASVDDERGNRHSLIVNLVAPYCFVDDPGCGVRGFDTVADAKNGCAKSKVYIPDGAAPGAASPAAPVNPCEGLPPKARQLVIGMLTQPAGTRLRVDWYEGRHSNFDRKSREYIREAAEAAGFVEYRGGHPWVTAVGNAWAAQVTAKKC